MIDRDRLVATFLELIRIDGVSVNERAIADEVMSRLRNMGIVVQEDDAGDSFGGNAGNVITRLDGTVSGALPILLCAHMDTIQSTLNIRTVLNNGTIATDQTTILGADDRAGVAIVLEILTVLETEKVAHGPIDVVFTVAEEVGMHGAKFVQRDNLRAQMGFVFDASAPPGSVIIEAPSSIAFTVRVKGKAAHAAVSPETGINAIYVASQAISQLRLGRFGDVGTVNVGLIQGGQAINIVPDEVVLKGEVRSVDVDWSRVLSFANKGLTYDFEILASIATGYSSLIDYSRTYDNNSFGVDVRALGPSDTAGQYQKWLDTPLLNRMPFIVKSNDKRVSRFQGVEREGKYFNYRPSRFRVERGTYHFSLYTYRRHAHLLGQDNGAGLIPMGRKAENDFLKAEALFRTGDKAGAATIINSYRVPNGELPPVSSTDPNLWEILKYEKRLETFASFPGRAWFDDRGWGDLVTGTLLNWPVPGFELNLLGLPNNYLYGGFGRGEANYAAPSNPTVDGVY